MVNSARGPEPGEAPSPKRKLRPLDVDAAEEAAVPNSLQEVRHRSTSLAANC